MQASRQSKDKNCIIFAVKYHYNPPYLPISFTESLRLPKSGQNPSRFCRKISQKKQLNTQPIRKCHFVTKSAVQEQQQCKSCYQTLQHQNRHLSPSTLNPETNMYFSRHVEKVLSLLPDPKACEKATVKSLNLFYECGLIASFNPLVTENYSQKTCLASLIVFQRIQRRYLEFKLNSFVQVTNLHIKDVNVFS